MEILPEFSASNDRIIAKGKRTKRPRSSSSSASSAAAADFICNSSPTSSTAISASTEEDEDLANCLILLARGRLGPQAEISKFSSRKFSEMPTTTAARVGIYVYECKTCSRTFPSFQALGGHRASHKRPKPVSDSDQNKSDNQEKEEEVDEHRPKFSKLNTVAPPPSTPPQLLSHVIVNKGKIHECSICGSEFASGQALGGHMRRHRSGPNSAAAAGRSDDNVFVEKTRSMLALDLNLPAPAEEDRRETEFRGLISSKQQPRIIFPAAALVDCHY